MLKDYIKFAIVLLSLQLSADEAYSQSIVDIAVGKHNGCALYDDGAVWCWGAEILPDIPGEAPLPLHAVRIEGLGFVGSISVGRLNACAVASDGSAWCWGSDFQATIREDRHVKTWNPVLVSGLPAVRELSIGFLHICALAEGGGVFCWGFNPLGELGDGTTDASAEPRQVQGIDPAIAVAAGVNNSCAVENTGKLKCWGTYDPTQNLSLGAPWQALLNSKLAVSLPVENLVSVANGRNFGCGILKTGGVSCWGSNVSKQLGTLDSLLTHRDILGGIGVVEQLTEVSDLDVHYFHACAVASKEVWCWGTTYDESDKGRGLLPYKVPSLQDVSKVGTGESHSCAIAGDEVLCWGWKSETEDILPGMSASKPVPVPDLPKSR